MDDSIKKRRIDMQTRLPLASSKHTILCQTLADVLNRISLDVIGIMVEYVSEFYWVRRLKDIKDIKENSQNSMAVLSDGDIIIHRKFDLVQLDPLGEIRYQCSFGGSRIKCICIHPKDDKMYGIFEVPFQRNDEMKEIDLKHNETRFVGSPAYTKYPEMHCTVSDSILIHNDPDAFFMSVNRMSARLENRIPFPLHLQCHGFTVSHENILYTAHRNTTEIGRHDLNTSKRIDSIQLLNHKWMEKAGAIGIQTMFDNRIGILEYKVTSDQRTYGDRIYIFHSSGQLLQMIYFDILTHIKDFCFGPDQSLYVLLQDSIEIYQL